MSKKQFTPKCRYETREGLQEEDEYVDEGEQRFGGFDEASTTLHRRVLALERKLDKWIRESMGSKENEEQEKEFLNLKERIKKVEENDTKLRVENEELKKELAKYKKQMDEGLDKVEKEKEDLKDLVNKEEGRVQDMIKKEVQTWRVQHKKDKENFQDVIQEQLKEEMRIWQTKL
ncbi:hypothetical protein E2C01_090004 [Portunus trituberculatus]|uniref:Uncharacterized protein n=1 Tax=Portunus trituberculatus TaxID=210409 RepID=A0A5B7JP00_PORTR|nr:hypothetical protein [Portunus trituberculatus]